METFGCGPLEIDLWILFSEIFWKLLELNPGPFDLNRTRYHQANAATQFNEKITRYNLHNSFSAGANFHSELLRLRLPFWNR